MNCHSIFFLRVTVFYFDTALVSLILSHALAAQELEPRKALGGG